MSKPYTYLLTHAPTMRQYIGVRWKNVRLGIDAKDDLWKEYFSSSKVVQSLPRDEFCWEVLEEFDTKEEAQAAELKMLQAVGAANNPWYLNQNDRPAPPDQTGTKKTEDHKRKIGESHKGMKRPPRSDEYKRKLSEANKGENNPNYGKKMSEEQKMKISEGLKGNQCGNKPVVLLHIPSGMRVYFASSKQASRALGLRDTAVTNHIYRGTKTVAKHYRAYYAE